MRFLSSVQIYLLVVLFVCVTHGTVSNWKSVSPNEISSAHRAQSSQNKIRIDGQHSIPPYDKDPDTQDSTQTGKVSEMQLLISYFSFT